MPLFKTDGGSRCRELRSLLEPPRQIISTRAGASHGADGDNLSDLGAAYALLPLMSVSPDFAAARFTIENDVSDVGISTGQPPCRLDLAASGGFRLQLELIPPYQRAEQMVGMFPSEGERTDSTWHTYGKSVGLLCKKGLPSPAGQR